MPVRCAFVIAICLGCGGRDAVTASTAAPSEPAIAAVVASTKPKSPCPAGLKLGPGLHYERAVIAAKPAAGEPCIDVVRADLTVFKLRVLTASREGRSFPAPKWADTFRLVAVTNAGMFHANGTPVGMIVEDGVVLRRDHPTYGGYLAFDPRSASDPAVTIAGRDCAGFDLAALQKRYRSIVQSNRLLGCAGEALPWIDKKQYSAAAIGVDRAGRVVFLHARGAVTMSELAQSVAALDLSGAVFLEGGPEASLVVRGADGELARVGSYETGFVENDSNQSFWWLPNVIALEAR